MSSSVTSVQRTTPTGTGRPSVRFLVLLALAVGAANGAQLASAILTLSRKSSEIDAAGATTVLSIVVGIGSVFQIIAYPLAGRLSDRTLSRLGRRRPYLLLGALLVLLGAGVTIIASNVGVLVLGYSLTAVGVTVAVVAAAALVPDQVAAEHRGTPSAMIGLGAPIGAVLGLFLAQLVEPNLAAMIMLPAAVAVVAILLLAFLVPDAPLAREDRPAFSLKEFLGTFWTNPFTHPAYGLAWWSRLMIFFGVGAVNAYQPFYLIAVHHVDPLTVGKAVFLASLLMTGLSLAIAPVVGKLSDKIGRRKPFVIGSALVFAIGLGIMAMATTYPMFLLAVAVMGVGQGVYFAVDMALVMDVLPDKRNPAKDLGIMNLANSLPTSLIPAMAPTLLAIGATAAHPQNYAVLFLAGTGAAILGALFILPIKGVK